MTPPPTSKRSMAKKGNACPHCGRSFPKPKALEDHIARSHPDEAPSDGRKPMPYLVGGLVVVAAVVAVVALAMSGPAEGDREAMFHISGSVHLGDPAAPVAIIAFEGPQCPSCRLFHVDRDGSGSTFEKVVETYVDTGQVVYVEKTFFIGEPWERIGAQGQKCAWYQDTDAFFSLTHDIYVNQTRLTTSTIRNFMSSIALRDGLDVTRFNECIDNEEGDRDIARDVSDGQRAGVRGTPTFIIMAPDGTSQTIVGPQPFPTFANAIVAALETEVAADAGG